LIGNPLKDISCLFIGKISSLRQLKIVGSRISHKAVKFLSGLHQLERILLRLDHPSTDADKCCLYLSDIRSLKTVSLPGVGVTSEGAFYLSKLHNIEKLFLVGNCIDAEGFQNLSKLKLLRILDIKRNRYIDKRSATAICSMKALKYLIVETDDLSRVSEDAAKLLHKSSEFDIKASLDDIVSDFKEREPLRRRIYCD